MRQLIELAQAKPGTLNAGSSGVGTPNHLGTELLKALANVNSVHVPYKGSPQGLQDLMAGQVQLMFDNLTSSSPHVKSGKLRALAVTSAQRMPGLPQVPTMAEAGMPGVTVSPWQGIFGPPKLPREIVERLAREKRTELAQACFDFLPARALLDLTRPR